MELAKETDHALLTVVFTLTGIVFVLDLLTPSEIAVWTLYLVPLGLSRWSSLQTFDGCGLAVLCTSLIILCSSV